MDDTPQSVTNIPVSGKKNIRTVLLYSGLVCAMIFVAVGVWFGLSANKQREVNAAVAATQCSLQESKPVLIIVVYGKGAGAMCVKIITSSNGRYFAYYGENPFTFIPICSVTLKKTLQFTVYDSVPDGENPKTRYSYMVMCPGLLVHHRLQGEGF